MLPPFDHVTGHLPPGVHEAAWDEVVERFGWTEHRRALLGGLRAALLALREAGCRRVYLDGSFATANERPGDFDGCWVTTGVDWDRLAAIAPSLLDFSPGRPLQKATYGGELFPADWPADFEGTRFQDFFQRDREGNPKGIVALDLEGMM